MSKIKKYELTLRVLEYLSKQEKVVLRQNIINEPSSGIGSLERHFNITLTIQEKNLLALVLNDLQERGLIEAVFRDMRNSGNDMVITDKGREALQNKTLDSLDELLKSIDPSCSLIEKRYGAYDASLSKHRDWQRHVAVSLVELIDHTLRILTPDIDEDKIDKSKKGSIRKARITQFILKKHKEKSKSTEKVIEKAFELSESIRDKLEAIKHGKSKTDDEVEQLIKLTEGALYFLLNR